ncbi:ABC transporter substrate-binding protein [Pseudomonas sp. A3.4]|nr:ABC transporter substrate-binding protein [Atopomonas sediminilitoris]MCJ8168389.1 ABC transporter substrate-binding protein [Atopomonas sediminilitoris]
MLWVCALSLCGQFAWADQAKIILSTENFPPYNMATNGKNFAREDSVEGIAVEVVQEMFKRAGVEYFMALRFPWDRVYKMALEKPNHGVFSTARTPEREGEFKWVGPIGPDDWVLLASADSTLTINSLEEAKAYTIGAYKGDAIEEFLLQQGIEPKSSFNDKTNVEKLSKGQIDLWATGDPAGRYLAKQQGVTNLKTVLRFNQAELWLALNKQTDDAIVAKLQAALDTMRNEGFVDKVLNKYLQ